MLVDHATNATIRVTGHDGVTDAQRAALDQHRGYRAAAAVQVRLDGHTLGFHVWVGPQVESSVRGQQHRLEQRLDVGALLRRDVDEHRVAAEVLGHQVVLGELRPDLGRVGALLVDLVDRHHDRHVGRLRVVDGLHRLRHDAVVGRDHQDRDVGGLRATGTHGGERLVARGVDKGDRPLAAVVLDGHLVGADVLGDATGLALTHAGVTDGVQQSGLAVVDVTHDGDDRRPDLEIVLAALVLAVGEVERLQQFAVFVLGGHDLHDVVHLAAEQFEGLVTDGLGGGHHLTEVEQRLNQCSRVGVDLLGEVHQRRTAGETDDLAIAVRQPDATDDGRLHVLVFGAFRPLRLATALRRATGTTERTCGSAALTWASAATAAAGTTAIACARWGTATGACTGTAAGATAAVVTAAAATAAAGDDHLGPHRGHDRRDRAGRRRRRGDRWEPGEAHRAAAGMLPGDIPGLGAPGRGAPGRGACGRGIGRSTG